MHIYKVVIIFLYLISFSIHASSVLVKENSYGRLTSYPDDSKLVFSGSYGKINITKASTSLKYSFYDGSHVYIDLSKNIITRYSAKTRRTENFSATRYPTSLWDVNNQVKASFSQYKNFNDYPDMKDIDPDPCDSFSSPRPCNHHPLGNGVEINLFDNIENRFSIASSSCSTERNNFLDRGFNGYSSLERCRLSSTLGVVATGVGVLGCMIEPTKLTCGIAIPSYAAAIVNHGDTTLACYNSWRAAHKTLQDCETESDGSSSGGAGGNEGSTSGNGSGGNGGSGGFRQSCYSVVTGGGVTSWCEIYPV
nr:hypothetical protein [Lelliottia steviae]